MRRAQREQIELLAVDLDSVLPPDHQARLVWGYVERQDWSELEARIKARGSVPGRRAIDPRILFALWLYATLQGVGSGREVARLSRTHDAYRWICGGVGVNYHALNDFRADNERWFDELLSDNVAALAAIGVITLKRVAHDGVRVRANAGAASFRRRERLNKQLGLARELVRTLKEQVQADPGAAGRRAQAAREHAAVQREQRIAAALARLPELEEAKRRNGGKREDARASTTDAQASVMKMADGGYRPAYNVQYASDCASQMVVGVEVSTAGSDMAQLAPMVQQVQQRLGRTPEQWLVDGGFPAHEQLDAVADKTEVYAPVPKPRTPRDKHDKGDGGSSAAGGPGTGESDTEAALESAEPAAGREFEPKPDDSPAVVQWRQRMAGAEAREIYKDRAATAECVNAQMRNHGLQRMPMRGLLKARGTALLHALAHNLRRMFALAAQMLRTPPEALRRIGCAT
ncbi:MAG: IS1182 family transposase [Burkholderiales bacterium]|nr:IS1182 family transposase [Burkholderiales bacterium]